MTGSSRRDIIITASIVIGVVGILLALAGLILGGFGSSVDKDQVVEQTLDLPYPQQTVPDTSFEVPKLVLIEPKNAVSEQGPSSKPPKILEQKDHDDTSQAPRGAVVEPDSETRPDPAQELEPVMPDQGTTEQTTSEAHGGPEEVIEKNDKKERVNPKEITQGQETPIKEPASKINQDPTSKDDKIAKKIALRTKIPTQGGVKSKTWLLQQDSNHYTIQILAVRRLQALKDYTVAHPIPLDLAYYRTQRGDREFYVLVAGVFPTREAAKAAVAKMPKRVRANTPWIRKLEAVQRAIK